MKMAIIAPQLTATIYNSTLCGYVYPVTMKSVQILYNFRDSVASILTALQSAICITINMLRLPNNLLAGLLCLLLQSNILTFRSVLVNICLL